MVISMSKFDLRICQAGSQALSRRIASRKQSAFAAKQYDCNRKQLVSAMQGSPLHGKQLLGPPSPPGAPAAVVLLALAQRCADAAERFAALQVR